jgi:hypothetical protein
MEPIEPASDEFPMIRQCIALCVLPANSNKKKPTSGLDPLTSAVQRRHDTLLDLSGVCKIAAKSCTSVLALFLPFQEIYSGCCTVAAQR